MDPIATYSEVRFDGARTFMLFPDRIFIRGKKTFVSDFETEIPLVSLNPRYFRLNIRNPAFMPGILLAVVSYVTCTILLTGLKMTFADEAPGMVACIGIGGVILAIATYPKVEFLRFKDRTGSVVILDLARSGKQVAQLDSFINALTKQIKLVREIA